MSSAQSHRTKYLGLSDSHPLFASLPVNVVREIETELIFSKHDVASILYNQGEKSRGIFLVFTGRVKLSSVTMHARTALLKIAGAGDILSLAEALSDHEHLTTAQVTASSSLAFLHHDNLMNAMQKYPEFRKSVFRYLAKEKVRADFETLSLRVPCSSSQRLAAALVHMANGRGHGFEANPTLTYTHAELAQLIGASRETVTRLLNRFEEKAMVASRKSSLTIVNFELLEQIAELG